MTMSDEHVLVVPEWRFLELGKFSGFRPFSEAAFAELLKPAHLEFRPRSLVEEDPSFKQLIPYVILEADVDGQTALFQYTRGKGQGEARLHAKRSIGIGGHISREDVGDGSDLYRCGMQRELCEEVELNSAFQEELVGFIYDDASAVGRVHLGVVHRLRLESPHVAAREVDIADSGFRKIEELREGMERFETWSQLCLQYLYADTIARA
jgi:predicted NUDIX family phosphoesterase